MWKWIKKQWSLSQRISNLKKFGSESFSLFGHVYMDFHFFNIWWHTIKTDSYRSHLLFHLFISFIPCFTFIHSPLSDRHLFMCLLPVAFYLSDSAVFLSHARVYGVREHASEQNRKNMFFTCGFSILIWEQEEQYIK